MAIKSLESSHAVSEAVRLADVDVVSAYPITPQTHIVEKISSMVADGELEAEFILVESEQTAMSACIGASAVGARTFTATCSQGLALMSEMLFIASGLRLPIVMAVANRALSSPINIWNDHSDVMAQRDCGWIQFFVENAQEALDMVLQAYKIGEDKRVHLPVMVNLDGFILSHVTERVDVPDEEKVREFLPPKFDPLFRLHPDNPITMGPVGHPDVYTEIKKAQEEVLLNSRKVIKEVWAEFERIFGRKYNAVEVYKLEGAEAVFICMGGICETAASAVDQMREEGLPVGLVKIRQWRPFPFEEFYEAIKNVPKLLVVDRAISFGGPVGPVFSEIRSFMYDHDDKEIYGFVAGLGGRDVKGEDFRKMFELSQKGKFEYGKSVIVGLKE